MINTIVGIICMVFLIVIILILLTILAGVYRIAKNQVLLMKTMLKMQVHRKYNVTDMEDN